MVIVQAEPNGLMMVRYKLHFSRQHPDPEDPWVLSYLQEHGLEPRRRLDEEHDGVPYQVLHFGQCYLGRHVEALGNLYQRGIEHTTLARHIHTLLAEAEETTVRARVTSLDEDALRAVTTELAAQLHATAGFEVGGENDLQATIDTATVTQAFLALPLSPQSI